MRAAACSAPAGARAGASAPGAPAARLRQRSSAPAGARAGASALGAPAAPSRQHFAAIIAQSSRARACRACHRGHGVRRRAARVALVPCRAISEDGGFEGAARDDAREPDAFFSSADWLRGNESCALCGGTGRKACGQCEGAKVNREDLFGGRFRKGDRCWLCEGSGLTPCGCIDLTDTF